MCLLVACLLVASSAVADTCNLGLLVTSPAQHFELGSEIALRFEIRHIGGPRCYLEQSTNLGRNAWFATASCASMRFETEPLHFDRPSGENRFDYIPLQEGDRFSSDLPSINSTSPVSLLTIRVAEACEVVVSFSSTATGAEVGAPEVWRGTLQAPPISFVLLPPSPGRISEMRRRLALALADTQSDAGEAVRYFAIVRDNSALQLLHGLLSRDPTSDPMLVEAIVNQRDSESIKVLRDAATKSRDKAIANSLREGALTLEEDVATALEE